MYTVFNGNEAAASLPTEVSNHPLYEYYKANFGNYKPLAGAVADLNNDGVDDLLIAFSYDEESNKMIAILGGDRPLITPMAAAPLEDIMIEIKNVDKKPPNEFVISGSKGGQVGYGIYYIKNGKIVNMFDNNMADCCL